MDLVDNHFEALLVYLKETRGFDFTGYKRSSLMRRARASLRPRRTHHAANATPPARRRVCVS